MSQWSGFGSDKREYFENSLLPKCVRIDLAMYQDEIGDEFTIDHLMKIYELKSKAMLAEAITDLPEYLFHQIGVYEKSYDVPGIGRSIERLTDFITEELELRK